MIKDLFVSSIKRHNYPKTLKLITGVKGHRLYSILLNKKRARSNSVFLSDIFLSYSVSLVSGSLKRMKTNMETGKFRTSQL